MIAITPWILVLVAAHQDPKPEAQPPAQSTPAQAPTGPPPAEPAPAKPEAQEKPGTNKLNIDKPDVAKPDANGSAAQDHGTQDQGAGKTDANKPDAAKTEAAGGAVDSAEKPTPDAAGWLGVDGVALIINQDITTRADLEIQYWREYHDKQVTDPQEIRRRRLTLANDRVERSLAMQAGQDMVDSPALIADQVNAWFERWVKSKGGIVATTKFLQDQHKSTQDLRQEMRESIYVNTWKDVITGEGPGVAKRPQRDRFIRPGELKFTYNQLIADPGKYGLLGGTAETVTLKRLFLDPDENGGMDKTNELARDLRRRILEGDDMDALAAAYGKGGLIKDVGISSLAGPYPKMARFADQAQVDDVSEPMPFPTKGKTFVQILRLVEKKAGVKPDLASPEVQKTMTKELKTALDEYRLDRAYKTLYDTSYVWPEEHSKPAAK